MPSRLQSRRGQRLDHVFTSCGAADAGLVLVGHGVTSSHDRPYFVDLCDALGAAGLDSVRFSFAGNGESEGRFEDCTITGEVEDLRGVLDAFPGRRVAYVGHSMGGAVGVLTAARDERIRALVSLAGMVRVQNFMERTFGGLVPGRDVMLGRERCPLSRTFLDDARAIGDVLDAAARIDVPWLLVHGTADELVPVEDSVEAAAASRGRAELVRLEGADHRFTDRHPDLLAAVVPWLAARVGPGSRPTVS